MPRIGRSRSASSSFFLSRTGVPSSLVGSASHTMVPHSLPASCPQGAILTCDLPESVAQTPVGPAAATPADNPARAAANAGMTIERDMPIGLSS